jgi:exodeoxyribonuclease VII large subunit
MSENLTQHAVKTEPNPQPTAQPTVLSVEDLNRQIRQLIEGQVGVVWVRGELSNFKPHTSGHFYFSLKDSKSQISAVMFRGSNSRLRFKPHDGLEVLVRGRVSVYEPRGNYQIVCDTMEPVGAGALQKAFEQLKEKLKLEGLFEPKRKRALPTLPKHIAIVTSPTGAAIRDMLNILGRRNRMAQITIVPTVVQGESAAPQIVEAMKKAYRIPGVEVVIVGRGGGSIEDMWCFNDETLARTICMSPVPVISAVGHEIDFTIADFVADVRAPTPSAAAELVARSVQDLNSKLDSMDRLLQISQTKILRTLKEKLNGLSRRLVDPKRTLQQLIQRNDELTQRLVSSTRSFFQRLNLEVRSLHRALKRPDQTLSEKKSQLQLLLLNLKNHMQREIEHRQASLEQSMSVLDSLSPLKVVERGYSMTTQGSKLIKSASQVKVGELITVRLMQGQLTAKIENIENETRQSKKGD